MSESIELCDGYKTLLASVVRDEDSDTRRGGKFFHDYRGKLAWVIERAKHYADKIGVSPSDVLDAWEKRRTYWYMNYYQDCEQPLIGEGVVRVFDTIEEMRDSIGSSGFRCPNCGRVSKDAYRCDAKTMAKDKECDWTSYGLFRTMGKGVHVFVKEKMVGQELFMPIAWENGSENAS